MHNQKNDNNKFKNKNEAELPENWTLWKSDNQGVKERLIQTSVLRQKKIVQRKEQIKAPEKIELSNEAITNQSDTQFKTLVIRKLTDMVEYGCEIEEKVKAMKSEIKENV